MRKVSTLSGGAVLMAVLGSCGCSTRQPAQGRETAQASGTPSASGGVGWPLPAGDPAYGAIDGRRLWQYVKEQAEIAERYRDQGHPQYWGRIAGTSGDVEDARWLLAKYQDIGLTEARIQDVALFLPQWAPVSWEVTASAGGDAIELTSAQPPYGAPSTDGRVLDVPAVYVGLGSEADFAGRDVRGKAVFFVRSGLAYNVGPADVLKRAEDRGAAAIFGSDSRGGNFNTLSYAANTTVPTFNLGTEDGLKVRDMMARAPAGRPRVRIRMSATWESGQKSFLVWGTLPGATDETIYVIAHRDGWFDAAGDNASGVATMLGLAEYFAKVPRSQRQRTMIFIGTDGHHAVPNGGFGREWLAANREKFFAKTALMINAEHPAEALTHGATNGWTNATLPLEWYAGGSSRPRLTEIALDAFHEFGVPIWAQPSRNPPSGDVGPFVGFLPGVVAQANDFVYMHTTGDTPDNVTWYGLEAATRAYAKIIDEMNTVPLSDLQRPVEQRTPRLDLTNCAAWVQDSTKPCEPK
jgi:Zn-dependent M28 family amino/carboxypeptidase